MSETTSDFSSFELDDFSSFTEEPEPAGSEEPTGTGAASVAVVDADLAVRDYLAMQLGDHVAKVASLAEMEAAVAENEEGGGFLLSLSH